jgi:hypothetical protein
MGTAVDEDTASPVLSCPPRDGNAARPGRETDRWEDKMDTEYKRMLAAVGRADKNLWHVVEAAVADIEKSPTGRAKHGEYARCAAYLASYGFGDWKAARIRQFHQVGVWINASARRTDFIGYPFEWVRDAKDDANSDYKVALASLALARKKRDIRSGKKKRTASSVNASGGNGNGDGALLSSLREAGEEMKRAVRAHRNAWQAAGKGLSEQRKPEGAAMVAKDQRLVLEILAGYALARESQADLVPLDSALQDGARDAKNAASSKVK